jgi:branched-chain amino acid transport system permease protein
MIGSVWFFYVTQVQPNTGFDPLFDLTIVLMAFLGGYGSIAGTVLGALIIEPLTLWLNTQPQFSGGYLSEILLGAVFLLVVLFMPRGIVPTVGEWITKIRTRGRPAVVPATSIGTPDATGAGDAGAASGSGSVSATSIGSGSTGGAR